MTRACVQRTTRNRGLLAAAVSEHSEQKRRQRHMTNGLRPRVEFSATFIYLQLEPAALDHYALTPHSTPKAEWCQTSAAGHDRLRNRASNFSSRRCSSSRVALPARPLAPSLAISPCKRGLPTPELVVCGTGGQGLVRLRRIALPLSRRMPRSRLMIRSSCWHCRVRFVQLASQSADWTSLELYSDIVNEWKYFSVRKFSLRNIIRFYPNTTTLRSGIISRTSVSLSSVTFVCPSQPVEIFRMYLSHPLTYKHKKLIRRWDSERELTLRRHYHVLKIQ